MVKHQHSSVHPASQNFGDFIISEQSHSSKMVYPEPHDCFHHQPLDLTENTFRLLDIHGISKEGLIECTIGMHSRDEMLDQDIEYRALSYAWGPENPTYYILLNGKPFRVRENLLQFLQAALSSHPTACTRIWIDAICIDQENNSEKTHQVMQMASIYRDARSVFVWLGQPKVSYKDLHLAVTLIEANLTQHDLRRMSLLESTLCVADHPASHQVRDLLMREYWKRMWIIQEIITAGAKARLLCGEHSFAWYPIRRLVRLHDHRWKGGQIGMAVRVIRFEDGAPFSSHSRTILQLLRRLNGGGACADVRDKVYSLLGLLGYWGDLRPDYSISTECLFFRVLQDRIQTSEDCHVVLRDASILRKSLGLDFRGLQGHLQNVKDKQDHLKDLIRLRGEFFELLPVMEQFFPDEDCDGSHSDQDIGATTSLPKTDNVLFEFARFGVEDEFRKAIVFQDSDPGPFKYMAMAEYRRPIMETLGRNNCLENEPWYLYQLPVFLSAECFADDLTQILVPSEVFLVLMKLSELDMSINDSRVDEKDFESLGISDGLVITHSSTFTSTKQQATRVRRSQGAARDYYGQSGQLRRSA